MQDVMDIANQMLWVTVLLSAPVLLTALVVGVVISLVQTVTGVQEMTITFVPKMLAVLVALAAALPWMSSVMIEYTESVMALMSGQ
jgi:flagellar biosynthetic protein FliQ